MTYLVKLTEGNSEGNYNIYYNNITPGVSNLMTVAGTSDLATNITLVQLLQGIEVTAPVVPTKVIVYGIECDTAIELTFTTSTPKNIPPIYCFSYLSTTQTVIQFTPNNNLYNGEFQWTSTDGSMNLRWNPFFNSGVGRWEIVISGNLLLVNQTKTNGLPSGSWSFIGSTPGVSTDSLNKSLVVKEGICTPTQTFSCSLKSTPNSCTGTKFYDGTITVTVVGGTPPYFYNNGFVETTWPVFNSVAPGNYTIITRDANGDTTSCTTTVGDGDKKVTYQVSLNYFTNDVSLNENTKTKRTTFDVSVQPELPVGTTISLTLSFVDLRTVASPGTGTVSNTLEITKNGNTVPITSNTTRQVNNPRQNCTNYNQIETTILKTCTVSITNGDTIEGVLDSTVNLTSSQIDNTTNCATELENIVNLQILNPTSNCRCCDISIVNQNQIEIMNNKIIATKKTISGALTVQLAYSEADCDTACSSTIGIYYRTCFTLAPNCEIFTDATLTTKAPAGYYSDYTNCYYFNGDSIVDSRLCPLGPPTNTIKYYKADVFRCLPFNCTIPIDNIIVSVDPNYTLIANSYYRDVEYSDFVYEITQTRGVTGPATRNLDPNTQSSDCQACCSITPP